MDDSASERVSFVEPRSKNSATDIHFLQAVLIDSSPAESGCIQFFKNLYSEKIHV